MKTRLLLLLLLFPLLVPAQERVYTPDWESIDSRPIPSWFPQAKFGIFIHWGLYSVPAWSPKGTYSEWYKYWLDTKALFGNGDFAGDEVYQYHCKTYGQDFTYADFAPLFIASEFDAGEWADLLQQSGARYVVLTTKHHDGFALWDSKEASRDYGRPWNSCEIGAHRDLVREFVDSVRQTPLKVGLYFSLREWDNPLYTEELMPLYLDRHFYPQLKDLIHRFQPDLIWSDGPDAYDEDIWRTKDFLSWLYSESEIRDSVVVNDRWAKFKDKKHGDYLTSEYSATETSHSKPWEECRGIGLSFGYNRNEDLEDYATPEALIFTLSKIVSRGGNLLLNIGPRADGKIPPIMQERLLQIGEWLHVNGEAIYGTTPCRQTVQWSEGKRDWKPTGKYYVHGNAILKQTIAPEPGYAVQEAFFTRKGDSVYAILTSYRDTFVLKNRKASPKTVIKLLGYDKPLKWEQNGSDIVIHLPRLLPNEMPCHFAWVLKFSELQDE